MPKKTKEELLHQFKSIIGDNTSDEVVSFLEDFNDSYGKDVTDLEVKVAELEAKAKEIEDSWRKKYTDRFFDYSNPIETEAPQIDVVDEAQETEGDVEDIPSVEEIAANF